MPKPIDCVCVVVMSVRVCSRTGLEFSHEMQHMAAAAAAAGGGSSGGQQYASGSKRQHTGEDRGGSGGGGSAAKRFKVGKCCCWWWAGGLVREGREAWIGRGWELKKGVGTRGRGHNGVILSRHSHELNFLLQHSSLKPHSAPVGCSALWLGNLLSSIGQFSMKLP